MPERYSLVQCADKLGISDAEMCDHLEGARKVYKKELKSDIPSQIAFESAQFELLTSVLRSLELKRDLGDEVVGLELKPEIALWRQMAKVTEVWMKYRANYASWDLYMEFRALADEACALAQAADINPSSFQRYMNRVLNAVEDFAPYELE